MMPEKPTKRPTALQARFIEEFLIDANEEQAAVRAGAHKKQGWKWLNQPQYAHVRAEVERRQSERAREFRMEASWVVDRLVEVFDRAVALDDLKEQRKTLELLGKHQGMFTQRHHHTGKITLADMMRNIAEEDIEAEE
ncbi:MAG: terminase small subunit [Vulcanimicrobiota bacterium]